MHTLPINFYMKRLGEGNLSRVGTVLFKPECPPVEISNFIDYCKKNKIFILSQRNVLLSRATIIALYPKIFSFSKDDIDVSISWKYKVILYLNSAPSICFFLDGDKIQQKLRHYKYLLRKKYSKISRPDKDMSEKDIFEYVIKNHIHVVDRRELQNSIWLLFSGGS